MEERQSDWVRGEVKRPLVNGMGWSDPTVQEGPLTYK